MLLLSLVQIYSKPKTCVHTGCQDTFFNDRNIDMLIFGEFPNASTIVDQIIECIAGFIQPLGQSTIFDVIFFGQHWLVRIVLRDGLVARLSIVAGIIDLSLHSHFVHIARKSLPNMFRDYEK